MNGHQTAAPSSSLSSAGKLDQSSPDLILQLIQLNAQMFADLVSYRQFANRFSHYLQYATRDPYTSMQHLADEFGRLMTEAESKLFNVDHSIEMIIGMVPLCPPTLTLTPCRLCQIKRTVPK